MQNGTFNTFITGESKVGGYKPVWRAIWGKLPGGFMLRSELIEAGDMLKAGTVVECDLVNRTVSIPSVVESGKTYGLIENDVYLGSHGTAASVAVVYHGEVIRDNVPDMIEDMEAALPMIKFV